MSFTDQKPRIATESDLKASFGGEKNGEHFRCYVCGKKFKVGDYWRWVYMEKVVNSIVCESCDGSKEEIAEKMIKNRDEFLSPRFWWFRKNIEQS